MNPLDFVKLFIPPLFLKIYRSLRNKMAGKIQYHRKFYGLSGSYRTWSEAMSASSGYDSRIILEKTKKALLRVKNGEAAYERDSVLFDDIQYSWPLLAGLMWIAGLCKGTLNVLDFGGSLGSSYFQNRRFLSDLPHVRWNIVEQPNHVRIGKEFFEDNYLRFYSNITDCLADTQPNVVLVSSVLQYLEHPHKVLAQLMEQSCNYLIIDRTPFWNGSSDYLCVQAVPPDIYPASYPSWIFSKQLFHSRLREDWETMATFDDLDMLAGPIDFSFQGMILVRRTRLS